MALKQNILKISDLINNNNKIKSVSRQDTQELFKIVDYIVNFKLFARISLGNNINKFSREELAEFSSTITTFLKLISITILKKVEDQISNPKIQFGEYEKYSENKAILYATISYEKDGAERRDVQFHLYPEKDKLVIYDITVQGVTFSDNYRRQFDSFLSKRKPSDLILLIEKRILIMRDMLGYS